MSILIKGMKMPESCQKCPMLEGDYLDGLCHATGRWLDDESYWKWGYYDEYDIDESKPLNCPLVELPPHGRLIDADKFKHDECEICDGCCETFNGNECSMCHKECRCEFMKDIDEAPTIIEAEE